ncbi:hypothetical protein OGAPHI_003536 [Ogataea philodendri]|uniref:ATP-dependent RNA helicase n=1 Tax=Ogataea philodendri TaxID=1378263 RepID=A0A9P8P8B5_9ASCO|nr:uncharacterized protein OGAPHI_003536 [Ogataea philodendri]KAH3666539.1 hypothetical protein OGAPHI_003536 [Ogataea philodendri]
MQKGQDLSWGSLPYSLIPWLQEALISLGYTKTTPVQASTIPMFSNNKDVIVQAVTGSGKTLSYVIPIVEKVCAFIRNESSFKKGHFGGLIVCPTKELALQIKTVTDSLLEFNPDERHKLSSQAVVGGIGNVTADVQLFLKFRPQILVATPGRALEFLQQGSVKTSSCQVFVLDEADKLLDSGFSTEVSLISKLLPRQKRIGMFSATISTIVDQAFRMGMTNPIRITVKSDSLESDITPAELSLNYDIVDSSQKLQKLLHILTTFQFKRAIVYFPTCTCVTYFFAVFNHLLECVERTNSACRAPIVKLYSLHGKLHLDSRTKTLQQFSDTSEYKHILFSTDVAARGLDIPDMDLVVQVDPPTDPDVFVHRCGRAARAGKSGSSILFLSPGLEENYVEFMRLRNVSLRPLSQLEFKPDDYNFVYEQLQKWLMVDRGRHDKAIRAFVSYVKCYSKHVASSIFRVSSLNYWNLAKLFGIFRFPKMPENKFIHDFPEGGLIDQSFDFDSYKYLNEQKEMERLADMKDQAKKLEIAERKKQKLAQQQKNAAWSAQSKSMKHLSPDFSTRAKQSQKQRLLMDEELESGELESDWKELIQAKKKQKRGTISNAFEGI